MAGMAVSLRRAAEDRIARNARYAVE